VPSTRSRCLVVKAKGMSFPNAWFNQSTKQVPLGFEQPKMARMVRFRPRVESGSGTSAVPLRVARIETPR